MANACVRTRVYMQSNNQKKAEAQYHQISLGQMLDRERRRFDARILVYGSIFVFTLVVDLILLLYLTRDCRHFDFGCLYSRLHSTNMRRRVNEQYGTLHTKENTWHLGRLIHFRFPCISRNPPCFNQELLCKLYQIPKLLCVQDFVSCV